MPVQQVNNANNPSDDPPKNTGAFMEGTPVSPQSDERCFAEAQKDLSARPTMSIRGKIILGFVLLFLLCAGASITFLIIGSRINQKLKVMETVNSYAFEIQQARRFEKNFFLYQTNLPDALENIQNAREILKRESRNITEVIGPEKLNLMTAHLNRYESLLTSLRSGSSPPAEKPMPPARIEGELRQHGAEMIFLAANLVEKERKEVEAMTQLSRQVPLFFLVILLIVMGYLTHFLAQQIVRPLNRFVEYTLRIAQGDFTPIKPVKKYKDEFSRLAMAINWMLDQLKKNQEQYIQSRKMASIGTLTSGIAHELNNPLNNICITTESLMDDLDTISEKETRKRLQDIYTQAERASGTVRNLLDFTRMGQPAFVAVAVRELLQSTLNLARNEMELNNVKLDYDPEAVAARVLGDFSQLQQVFLNLVINAIQAMPQGGRLRIGVKTESPDFVDITVQDSGIGIPQSIINQIFDPFFTTKEKGTGLGLSTTYSIVKKHGGQVLVDSQLNQGSAFTVRIPKSEER
jgi:two-component system, NtrC family, sensor kinase